MSDNPTDQQGGASAPFQAHTYQSQYQQAPAQRIPQQQQNPQQTGGSWMLNVLTNIQAARAQQQQQNPGVQTPAAGLEGKATVETPHTAAQASGAAPPQPKGHAPAHEVGVAAAGQGMAEGVVGGASTPLSAAPAQSGKKRGRPKGSKNKPKPKDQEGRLPPHLPLEAIYQQHSSSSSLQLPHGSAPKVPEAATSAAPEEQTAREEIPPPEAAGEAPPDVQKVVIPPPEVEGEEELPAKRRRGKPKGRYLDDHITLEPEGESEDEEEY